MKKLKQILVIAMISMMTVGFVPMMPGVNGVANADTDGWQSIGTCIYKIETSGAEVTLTIAPAEGQTTGTLPDDYTELTNWPWHSERSKITKVVIEEGVKAGNSTVSMFDNCTALSSLDLSGFNTSQVKNMSYMFNHCQKISSLDVSSFDTSQVTRMYAMFLYCSELTSLNLSSFDTSQVVSMEKMFEFCGKLTILDASSFVTSNEVYMSGMFLYCYKLKTIYASDSFDTSNVKDSSQMFGECRDLVGGAGTPYNLYKIDKTYARIDGGPDSETPGYFTKAIASITSGKTTTKYASVQAAVNAAEDGDTITLLSDVSIKESIAIASNKKVTLDLAGHTIDRGLSSASDSVVDGHVIAVDGELTVKDSSEAKSGKLTGGYASCGGGVVVNHGKFVLESGTITGNKTKEIINQPSGGGGVFVTKGGTFVLKEGGVITKNTSDQFGGGVYVEAGFFDMKNGTISLNKTAVAGGGVCVGNQGNFILENGLIDGNEANSNAGGGVWINKTGTMAFHTGTISNNKSKSGAGIYVFGGTLNMYGGQIITNQATDKGAGIYIDENSNVYVGGTVTGNTAAGSNKMGGGICANTAFTVGGKAYICGNYIGTSLEDSGKTLNNVFIRNNTKSGAINIFNSTGNTDTNKKELISEYSTISISVEDPTKEFITETDTDYSKYFESDNAAKYVKYSNKKYSLEDGATITSENQLVRAINDAQDNSSVVFTLGKNIELTHLVTIPENRNIVLDLNGYTIDRGLSSENAVANGNAFNVSGKLSVRDTSENKQGTITGGNSTTDAGCVYVAATGEFNLVSGSLKGNKTTAAGGAVFSRGSVTMLDGEISNNEAGSFGGGIYISRKDQTATADSNTEIGFEMKGGKITNNTANRRGGGVCIDYYDLGMKMTGGEISGNTVTADSGKDANDAGGGGIWVGKSLTLGGNAVVKNNTLVDKNSNTVTNNVHMPLGKYSSNTKKPSITLGTDTEVLSDDASIGISSDSVPTSSNPVAFTSTTNIDYSKYFTSDNDRYYVLYNTDHLELALLNIKLATATNGTISVDNQSAATGVFVIITATPDSGYMLDRITVTDKDGNNITRNVLRGRTIKVPAAEKLPITVSATFSKIPTPTPEEPTPTPEEPTPTPTPEVTATESFVASGTAKASTNAIKWNAVSGADGYEIYFAKCGKTSKKIKTTTALKYTKKGLNTKYVYKYVIKAYKKVDGKKVYLATTPTIHVAGTKTKYSNATKVTVDKTELSLKVGETSKITGKIAKKSNSKTVLWKGHVSAKIRYMSSDKSVVTVDSKGNIKAVGEGVAYVYAVAANGVCEKSQITVESNLGAIWIGG